MALDVTKLLQQIADAVEALNARAEVMEETKVAFEAASEDYQASVTLVEQLRGQVNDLLGQTSTRVRVSR